MVEVGFKLVGIQSSNALPERHDLDVSDSKTSPTSKKNKK